MHRYFPSQLYRISLHRLVSINMPVMGARIMTYIFMVFTTTFGLYRNVLFSSSFLNVFSLSFYIDRQEI